MCKALAQSPALKKKKRKEGMKGGRKERKKGKRKEGKEKILRTVHLKRLDFAICKLYLNNLT
jgi:hypothetical protein